MERHCWLCSCVLVMHCCWISQATSGKLSLVIPRSDCVKKLDCNAQHDRLSIAVASSSGEPDASLRQRMFENACPLRVPCGDAIVAASRPLLVDFCRVLRFLWILLTALLQ